ncbi:hypothetical protein Pmani_029040 [Petrolisthes manimaculis]|uniref:Uncharacterized protein n=1 Tax=Petrolisthes manimaculis TaxID=1843537 RepID=A0AAE1P037_9EUCA|nr:hypothetical protein Pmani_029040 [Petrolisthes manimaculis]
MGRKIEEAFPALWHTLDISQYSQSVSESQKGRISVSRGVTKLHILPFLYVTSKMWEPANCCGCCTRKEGSLTIGILHLIATLIGIFVMIWAVSFVTQEHIKDQICHDQVYCLDIYNNAVTGIAFVIFLILAVELSFASMLIHGVRTDNACLMVPQMILMLLCLIITTIGALAQLVHAFVVVSALAGIFCMVINSLSIFFSTFLLLVLRSHRRDLLRDSGSMHARLTEEAELPAERIEFSPKY